jgi:hypothetical protein
MTLTVYRLDGEEIPTGECEVNGCGEPTYMWGCLLLDGYVDACEGHAVTAVLEALDARDVIPCKRCHERSALRSGYCTVCEDGMREDAEEARAEDLRERERAL